MVDERKSPILVQEIPEVRVNEGSQLELIDLTHYIQNPEGVDADLNFSAVDASGGSIPRGVMCSATGLIMGIPAKGTAKEAAYEIKVIAENGAIEALSATFKLFVVPVASAINEANVGADMESSPEEVELESEDMLSEQEIETISDELASAERKTQSQINDEMKTFWQELLKGNDLGDPDFLINRDITYDDVYYLLGRFAHFVIWNADDLTSPGPLKEIQIKGVSEHFKVFDRGCCLVAMPISLFSHERGLMDGVRTAKAMAGETFSRGWNIEFGGFDKMVSAAWVETRCLMEEHSSKLEVRHYQPTYHDYQLYSQLRG